MHYIKVSVLQEIVLDTIRKVCGFVSNADIILTSGFRKVR
jgi:hypothetical protein